MGPTILSKFRRMLYDSEQTFSLHDEIGTFKAAEINLKLKDETPFYIRPYPVSEAQKLLIDKELEKLRLLGVLEYGKGSHVSPMLLIKKPDRGQRLCADLRFLNTKVSPLHYITPLLRDALQTIGASRASVMSTIDIKHAFYSLQIHPSSRRFLTIAPYPGARTMQYKRLTQGLNT